MLKVLLFIVLKCTYSCVHNSPLFADFDANFQGIADNHEY